MATGFYCGIASMISSAVLDEEELQALREITAPAPRKPVILVVDDDRLVLAEMRELIEGANFRCLTAGSAAEALRRIRRDESDIDLLVTDLRMEHQGAGLELIRQLNEVGTFLPIIVLSGQADARDVIEAMRLNVLDFMVKPLDLLYFLDLLKRSL
jgi:DNA-binding NtrC family response regulator